MALLEQPAIASLLAPRVLRDLGVLDLRAADIKGRVRQAKRSDPSVSEQFLDPNIYNVARAALMTSGNSTLARAMSALVQTPSAASRMHDN